MYLLGNQHVPSVLLVKIYCPFGSAVIENYICHIYKLELSNT